MFIEILYLVTKDLQTFQIPIKKEEYIQMEDGGNETIMCYKLAYIVLNSQLLKSCSSLDTISLFAEVEPTSKT